MTLRELRRLAHRVRAAAYLDDAEERFAAAVRAAFRTAFAPVLDRFGAVELAAAGSPRDAVPDLDDLHVIRSAWLVQVTEELVPLLADLWTTGSLGSLLSFGESVVSRAGDEALDAIEAVLDRHASTYLDAAGNRLVGIGDTAWADARAELLAGFTEGESIDDLAARVAEALEVSIERATTIARTEVISASNAGSIAGVRVLGEHGPATKTWMATLDARTRESHADADGQEVGIDEPFDVGGDALDFPGDPAGSPGEVINCRCTLVYDMPSIDEEGRQTGGSEEDVATVAASTPEEDDMTIPRSARARGAFGLAEGHRPVPARSSLAVEDPPPVEEDPEDVVDVEVPAELNVRPVSAIMAVEGRWTGDGRHILRDALRWDLLPVFFTLDHEDTVPSVIGLFGEVRRIAWTDTENLIVAYGLVDLGPDDRPNMPAREFLDRFDETGAFRGGSIRIDDVSLGGIDPESIPEGDVLWREVVEDARLRAFSATPVGAFAEAAIFLDPEDVRLTSVDVPPPADPTIALPADEVPEDDDGDGIDEVIIVGSTAVRTGLPVDMLVAGAAPSAPPRAWFENPHLDRPTPLTVDDDGRVFGHLAVWGACHTGFAGQCITPPHSPSGYASFHTGELVCAGGERLPVGRLTMGTGHATTRGRITAAMAAAHYDHTGTAVADVRAGEDAYGVWLAGAVRPTVTEDQLRTMRSSPPSGDWRRLGGALDLIAALHVNVPGFPVPRARVASSGPLALVAAGRVTEEGSPEGPSLSAAAERIASSVGRGRPHRVAEILARVHPEEVSV